MSDEPGTKAVGEAQTELGHRELVLTNTVVIWASRVLLIVPQLVLVPFLISTLGSRGYGVFTLVWTLLLGVDQLERSLQSGVVKYSAAMLAKEESEELNRLLSSSQLFSLLIGVLAAGGIATAALGWDGPVAEGNSALLVVALIIPFVTPLTPYVAVIQARQRFYVNATAETLSKFISLGLVILWFKMVSPSLNALVVIMAVALFLSRAMQVPHARKLVPNLRIRALEGDRRSLSIIARFGGVISLASLCLVLNNTGVRWLMGILSSADFVADLAIMLMPGIMMAQFVAAVTITVMPSASVYEATERIDELGRLLIRSTRYTVVLTGTMIIGAMLLLEHLLSLWVGPEFRRLAVPTTYLMLGQGALLASSTAHHLLKGLGRLREVLISYFLGLVVIPGLGIVLVHLSIGDPYLATVLGLSVGAAATGISQLLFAVWTTKLRINDLLVAGLLVPMTLVLGVGVSATFLTAGLGIDSMVGRTLIASVAVLTLVLGTILVVADQDDREFLKRIANERFRRSSRTDSG